MKNLFVPYELSLLAKQHGFDEPCFSVYYSDKELSPFSTSPESCFTNTIIGNMSKTAIDCTAPIYDQLITWFETKGIFISVEYAAPDTNKFKYRIDNYNHVMMCTNLMTNETKPSGYFGDYGKEWYSERKECMIEAFKYAFKLLD
jgi:hypothetical protein